MYDRAPRVLRFAEGGGTEDHVGPGSYQVPFLKQQATGGYAPFLSLTARESAFTVASDAENAVPGPGHYNISGKQKISRSPSVSRSVHVPSIPSCGQSYGYDINDDDSIIRQFPPASDSTLGPAYYKPQFGFSSATLKYKGIHFGNSFRRLELPIKSGPGPGEYDIVQKKTPHYENVNIKKDQQKNLCSHPPRFNGIIKLQEEKERFAPVKSTTPGPGTYNEPRTAFKPFKKTSIFKNTPFGQSAARFTQGSKTEKIPGPGSYNILNNTITDNVSNKRSKRQRKSAFGSSVSRTFSLDRKEIVTPARCQRKKTEGYR
ncbi:sperm-tail PG-rich repeat-containing protein 2 [Artibeus jamaicensis]|uniref:sperm-tail PG-rich repeat-containing protein 2 n=1 Tax=Artibeus jamaicensis TaxID=9417 RepID=UPI00235AC899|nr:sperm-tail PG-rich repeat-containing protein 2 [Artibeus jamaicensis]